jgi:hypothetical protein
MKRLGDTPAFKDMHRESRVNHLDVIVRMSAVLRASVGQLTDLELRALADRLNVCTDGQPDRLRKRVLRSLAGHRTPAPEPQFEETRS